MRVSDARNEGRSLIDFCLSDNDVILKLAACDLLDDTLAVLNISTDNVYVLPTAKFVLAHAIQAYSSVVSARVTQFLESVQTIDWEISPEEVLLFQDTLGIDAGEAILYSATGALQNFIVATGDKVSLKALAKESACQHIAARLAGRVICLEQIIQLCIGRAGFDTIKSKIVPARRCDKALKAIFGSGLRAAIGDSGSLAS